MPSKKTNGSVCLLLHIGGIVQYSGDTMVAIKEYIPLAPYTIYKIGGTARYFVEARSAEEVQEAAAYAAEKKVPFFILGAGSNVLINDQGFDGMIIRMTGGGMRVDGDRIIADAGVMMARAAAEAARHGLTGFEWGIGVPGTIGGSVRGNAGCFGGEMKDVVHHVAVFDAGNVKHSMLDKKACVFGYRDSIFKQHPEWIVVSATLKLKKGDPGEIQNEVRRITMERSAKQDIGTKSCGCIFKNVPWPESSTDREALLARFPALVAFADRATIPASYLIDSAGMKSTREGGGIISPTHANFFINEGTATAEDITRLIAAAKDAVRGKYGMLLHEEIQYIGF